MLSDIMCGLKHAENAFDEYGHIRLILGGRFMNEKSRIYIVDDEMMAIAYFKSLVREASDDIEIVGEALQGAAAYPEICRLKPDIIFVDISMPVMNGLQLAGKLLKADKTVKIVLLTSYRDFDYVKKGMEMGVVSYMLKNELTGETLKEEIEKIMSSLKEERHKAHMYAEHNLRKFLTSQAAEEEDIIYRNHPLQRYGLLYICEDQPLSLDGENKRLSVYDGELLEMLEYPGGLVCRSAVVMGEGRWCTIFFIDVNVAVSKDLLMQAGEVIRSAMLQKGIHVSCIASRATKKFLELPDLYKELADLSDYTFFCGGDRVLWQEELQKCCKTDPDYDGLMLQLMYTLDEEDQNASEFTLHQMLEKYKAAYSKTEYTRILREIRGILKRYAERKKVEAGIIWENHVFASVLQVEEWLYEGMNEIYERLHSYKGEQYSRMIGLCLEYIHKNFEKNISVQDIANAANISEGHLRKCFKNELNITVVDYLTNYRIRRAKKMMKSGEYKISEIYEKVGFTSSQYFSYVFKKIEGVTPSEFLKSL